MPLILLGLLLLICLLGYSIVRYMSSGEIDPRSVRERYPHAFRGRDHSDDSDTAENDSDDDTIYAEAHIDTDDLRGDLDHIAENIKAEARQLARRFGFDPDTLGRGSSMKNDDPEGSPSDTSDSSDDDKTIIFPTDNVEAEKNKRNIH